MDTDGFSFQPALPAAYIRIDHDQTLDWIFLAFIFILVFHDSARGATSPDAAYVMAVNPGVVSIIDGRTETIAAKMNVPIKALLKSDSTGKAQLVFNDDSTLSVAPDTEITISEYVDTPQEENIVFNLTVGTARIITGEVSRRNPQAFTVNTPQASIGIRGTIVTIQVKGDNTFVYLSETSGQGVTVRNRHTGQTIRMRSPGRLIKIGPEGMTDRAATTAEAKDFADALRGKFTPRAVARAKSPRNVPSSAVRANLALAGNLPVQNSQAPQIDPYNHAQMAQGATLVAAYSPGQNPSTPVVPPAVTPPAPDVSKPDTPVPDTPTVPDVPDTPTVPEVPDTPVVGPDVPTPEPPVQNYVVSLPELAGTFSGTGPINFSTNVLVTPILTADASISFTVPTQYQSVTTTGDVMEWTLTYENITVPVLENGQLQSRTYAASTNLDLSQLGMGDRPSILDSEGYGFIALPDSDRVDNRGTINLRFSSNTSGQITGDYTNTDHTSSWNGG